MDQGNKRLEYTLGFKTETNQATTGLQAMERDLKGVSQAARAAQQDVGRVSSGGTYGVQGGGAPGGSYGVNWNNNGTSKSHAYAGSNPGYSPAMPSGPPPLPWERGRVPANGAGGGQGMDPVMVHGTLLLAAAVAKMVESVERFRQSIDRAVVTNDATGRRLTNTNEFSAVNTLAGIPGWQTSTNLWHGYLSESNDLPALAFRGAFGVQRGDRAADARRAYESQLQLGLQPFQIEAQRQQIDLHREGRTATFMGDAGATAADTLRRNMPGYLETYDRDPGLAFAQAGSVLPLAQLGASQRVYTSAQADSAAARSAVAASQANVRSLGDLLGPGNQIDAAHAPLVAASAHRDSAARSTMIAAENRLLEDQKRLEEAIRREQEAGLDVIQKSAVNRQALGNVARAQLTTVERDIGSAIDFTTRDPWDQMSILNAAKNLKEKGWGSISPEDRNLVRSGPAFLTDFANNQARDYIGQNGTPIFDQLRELTGQSPSRQLVQDREVLVKGLFQLNIDDAMADDIAKKLKLDAIAKLLKAVNDKLDTQGTLYEMQQQAGKAAAPGG